MLRFFLVVFIVSLAAAQVAVQRVELVLPGRCIESMKPGKNFECKGPDKDHMLCRGIMITYKADCAEVHVARDWSN
jgi:hypothetical protein